MTVEVIGIDHVFFTVRNLQASERFYDRLMEVLGFRKWETNIGSEPHVIYYNRRFAYVLRPARGATQNHDPYAPGLHHFCFRVIDEAAVDRAARALKSAGVKTTEPRYYPEYGPDYYATFLEDPDGIRLEVMNFRELRRKIMYDWEAREGM